MLRAASTTEATFAWTTVVIGTHLLITITIIRICIVKILASFDGNFVLVSVILVIFGVLLCTSNFQSRSELFGIRCIAIWRS
jgi:hypothetical protein